MWFFDSFQYFIDTDKCYNISSVPFYTCLDNITKQRTGCLHIIQHSTSLGMFKHTIHIPLCPEYIADTLGIK